ALHVLTEYGDTPGVGPDHAGDDIQERGLSGTVRTDEPDDLTPPDSHRRAVERVHPAEGDAEIRRRQRFGRVGVWQGCVGLVNPPEKRFPRALRGTGDPVRIG